MMKNFKTLLSIVFIATTLFFTSCSNDDEENIISIQDLIVTLDENPTNGQTIGTVQVDGNGPFSFSIDSQSLIGALNIDATTGELTVADATLFDFETNPTITATISVVDAINTGVVTINLSNVNELNVQDLDVTIDENPTNGDAVGTVQANGDGTLTYNITSQTPAGALSIDASTGELTIADAMLFDFETNPTITATISVDNSVNTATAIATINLNNVNELNAQDLDVTIDENPTNGDTVGTVQASGDGTLTYSITSQTPAGALSIDASTGELTVADATLFDFETNPVITATISVDNSVSTVTAMVTIDLENIHEVGDVNFGGVIFWVNAANDEGLVVSLTNTTTGQFIWDCSSVDTGATGTAIGTGQTNTASVSAVGCATPGSLFDVANNTSLNGFNDWFVPSVDEWIEIDASLPTIFPIIQANNGNSFFGLNWSSTELSSTTAVLYALGGTNSNGTTLTRSKTNDYHLRVIRAWTDF